ncbi:hypothetical protein Tco_1174854 [Tanacetum coccineum]
MCPLRFILIFLSATLAGIFFLRNINSHSDDDSTSSSSPSSETNAVKNSPSKIVNVFWTCVDMASGRYLWRNLVSVSKKAEE